MISESDEQALRENAKNQLETIRALRAEIKELRKLCFKGRSMNNDHIKKEM